MALSLRRRSLTRLFFILSFAFTLRLFFSSPSSSTTTPTTTIRIPNAHEIQPHTFFERATGAHDRSLNVHRHRFLQARMGRDERDDLFSDLVRNGAKDWWDRFQLPYITNKDTAHMDAQTIVSAIDQLLSLNGWVAGLCPTLTRPFGQNKRYDDLIHQNNLYYIAIVIHSADHFLVDQLAVIVQLAKRLGTANVFVSMLDYDSTDSTETLTDLCEAVLTLLGVPYRITRVPPMTRDPVAAYYPLEEAHARNLALKPLLELYRKRSLKFDRVIWLKGFTCPNDILETIKVSFLNEAAMVCGMDWAEHNGFFIFSDRWRTRDIDGDQFRQSKSTSNPDSVPPRDKTGAQRYGQHLPFQVFCCESGTHVVDPSQSYYKGISYRSGWETGEVHNITATSNTGADGYGFGEGRAGGRPRGESCLDSSQAWFCRDLWVNTAGEGMMEMNDSGVEDVGKVRKRKKRDPQPQAPAPAAAPADKIQPAAEDPIDVHAIGPGTGNSGGEPQGDEDANAGSDFDAMPESEDDDSINEDIADGDVKLTIPNGAYRPARILVNPRCVTTYAGVSHTQLALDLFGPEKEDGSPPLSSSSSSSSSSGGEGHDEYNASLGIGGFVEMEYLLEDWEGAPESFVCQEQKTTGGRKATKTQRRLGFSIHDELHRLYD